MTCRDKSHLSPCFHFVSILAKMRWDTEPSPCCKTNVNVKRPDKKREQKSDVKSSLLTSPWPLEGSRNKLETQSWPPVSSPLLLDCGFLCDRLGRIISESPKDVTLCALSRASSHTILALVMVSISTWGKLRKNSVWQSHFQLSGSSAVCSAAASKKMVR